jgi:hypothetical protein
MNWLAEKQGPVAKWREEALEGEPTLETQTAHVATEAAEALDEAVKAETYAAGGAPPDGLEEELGDVAVAALGVYDMLGEAAPAPRPSRAPEGRGPRSSCVALLERASELASLADYGAADRAVSDHAHLVLDLQARACREAGLRPERAVEAALRKNGQRDWAEHQEEATGR